MTLIWIVVAIVVWIVFSGLRTLAFTAKINPVAGVSIAKLQYNRMMFQRSISIFYFLYRYALMTGIIAYYCLHFYK